MWKRGIIIPIHKGRSRADPANYRVATLPPVLSKVIEAIIADALMGCLEMHSILASELHSFRQHRSCTASLLPARGSWTETVDCEREADVIYPDFWKTFDRLHHRILLNKPLDCGIRDPIRN